MKMEEIIDRLRNPKKYSKIAVAKQKKEQVAQAVRIQKHSFLNTVALFVALGVLVLAGTVWLITLHAKNRAEDLSSALDPKNVQGLSSNADFDPSKNITFVQIHEGQDRNVVVEELGTTLPIISRFNFQSITPKNYGIIGMAPWALTENFTANIQDPDLLRYLLDRKEVGEAFIARNDVAPLLADPQLLAALAQDTEKLTEFFENDLLKQILANPTLVRKIGSSRFMSYLLTSKAVKYYRDHPQEAAKIIAANPALNNLRQNSAVRQAVTENTYLKGIASELLGTQSPAKAPLSTQSNAK